MLWTACLEGAAPVSLGVQELDQERLRSVAGGWFSLVWVSVLSFTLFSHGWLGDGKVLFWEPGDLALSRVTPGKESPHGLRGGNAP